MNEIVRTALVFALTGTAFAAPRTQCDGVDDRFTLPGVSLNGAPGFVRAQVVWDDGAGPALFVGGRFDVAGDALAECVARWDGASFASAGAADFAGGGGTDTPRVNALCAYDDGGGAQLYAGGRFATVNGLTCNGIARFDGTTWSSVGAGLAGGQTSIEVLFVHDDGAGPRLFAGGSFTSIDGVPAKYLATWNGATWSTVGANAFNQTVRALGTFDLGGGPLLYIGGDFFGSAGPAVTRWNGATMSPFGNPSGYTLASVGSFAEYDDGGGKKLYVGSQTFNGTNVFTWDGSAWAVKQTGTDLPAHALVVHDDGTGEALYLGYGKPNGTFNYQSGVKRYSGSGWDTLESPNVIAYSLARFDAGDGVRLYVGGAFEELAGQYAAGIGAWHGGGWHPLIASLAQRDPPEALAAHDAGSGLELYGDLRRASSDAIRRWDGAAWATHTAMQYGDVNTVASFDLGAGHELFATGNFNSIGGTTARSIARWDGSAWQALGDGLQGGYFNSANHGRALTVFPFAGVPRLVAAGDFQFVGPGDASDIAYFNGTAWMSFGWGDTEDEVGTIAAVCAFDSGGGPMLYAGGDFTEDSGAPSAYLARWNGASWQSVGVFDGPVTALVVHDDGSGPALYAAGDFGVAGGVACGDIARFDGTQWSAMPDTGGEIEINALCEHDDGTGVKLVAAGNFATIGGVAASNLARWDGSTWSPIAGGTNAPVSRVASVGTDLWISGVFTRAGSRSSAHVARLSPSWDCAPATYCTAGTTSSGCVPSIGSTGTPSASAATSFVIHVAALEGQKTGHIFYGLNGGIANPWSPLSSSYLCVKAPSQRTGTQNFGGTSGSCDGAASLDWNAYVAGHPTALGVPFSAGQQVWAQLYFRDPPAPKTTNLSGGLTFTVAP